MNTLAGIVLVTAFVLIVRLLTSETFIKWVALPLSMLLLIVY